MQDGALSDGSVAIIARDVPIATLRMRHHGTPSYLLSFAERVQVQLGGCSGGGSCSLGSCSLGRGMMVGGGGLSSGRSLGLLGSCCGLGSCRLGRGRRMLVGGRGLCRGRSLGLLSRCSPSRGGLSRECWCGASGRTGHSGLLSYPRGVGNSCEIATGGLVSQNATGSLRIEGESIGTLSSILDPILAMIESAAVAIVWVATVKGPTGPMRSLKTRESLGIVPQSECRSINSPNTPLGRTGSSGS